MTGLTAYEREMIAAWLCTRAYRAMLRAIASQEGGQPHREARDHGAAAALYSAAAELREGKAPANNGNPRALGFDADYKSAIRTRMKRSGVTAAALARRSKISPTQLSRWFNTEMQPRARSVQRLEEAFADLTSAPQRSTNRPR